MRSSTARDAAEGLAEIEDEDARVQAALRVWREIHDTANVDDDPEDLDHAAMEFALAEADKLRTDVLLPGHVPMPRNADEAKAMWLLGERWIRDNAPEMIRPAGAEGGETQGAVEAMRGLAVATCCAMAEEAHGKARADHKQLGMKLQWLATAEAAEFLATAIRALPLPALRTRTTDGSEA